MPYAVLAHAGEDFAIGALVPYAVLARAGEEQDIGFVPFEYCCGFVLS